MWESYMKRSVEEEKDDRGVHGDRMAADDEPVWEHDPREGYDNGEQAAKHLSMMPDELRDLFQVGTEEIGGVTHYHIEPTQDLDQFPDGEGSDMGYTEKIINGFRVGLADGMYPAEIVAIQSEAIDESSNIDHNFLQVIDSVKDLLAQKRDEYPDTPAHELFDATIEDLESQARHDDDERAIHILNMLRPSDFDIELQEDNLNQPVGDEHNPGEPSNVDTGAMYQAMDRSQDLQQIASKYQDMTDAQLEKHAYVIGELIEMGEEERALYFDGEPGFSPF